MIYLYVKTHNKTGLKYLGKTTAADPHLYKGSGKVWTDHCKKHGYDYTTEILFMSESKEEIKEKGIYYSDLWNVVDSKEWANLKKEECDGGYCVEAFTPEANQKRSNTLKGRIFTEEHRKNLSAAGKGRPDTRSQETKELAALKASAKLKGKKKPEGFGEKIRAIRLGSVASDDAKNKMRSAWDETRRTKQSEMTKIQNANRPVLTCPHCGKQGKNPGNMRRYHFDKCKTVNQQTTLQRVRNTSPRYSKWILMSPEGDIVECTNMRAFCRDQNLNSGTMTEVALNNRRHHKGWTVIKAYQDADSSS